MSGEPKKTVDAGSGDTSSMSDDDTPVIEVAEATGDDAVAIVHLDELDANKGNVEARIKSYLSEIENFLEEESPSEIMIRRLMLVSTQNGGPRISLMTEKERDILNKMDLFDARPTLEFVEKYNDEFESGIFRLATKGGLNSSRKFVQGITFDNFELKDDTGFITPSMGCQIPSIRLKQILFSLPPSLLALSTLKKVSWKDKTPVPQFDRNGDPKEQEKWVDEEDFIARKVHPSRIYIGKTEFFHDLDQNIASEIMLTRIPKTVSNNPVAVFNYQIYTFLHEFMHSVLNLPVHNDKTGDIILDLEPHNPAKTQVKILHGKAKTLKQWLEELRNSVISGREPILTSDYAEAGRQQLLDPDPAVHMPALIELVCETFAAYMIDIMPNRHGYTSFGKASFGNSEYEKNSPRKSGCMTDRFRLIKELCESTIIRSEK